MTAPLRLFKRKKERASLFLDIGTEAVKSLILQEKEGKIEILGSSLEYFERAITSEIKDFERDILRKTIFKTIEEAKKRVEKRIEKVFITFSAETLKGRVVSVDFNRKISEKPVSFKRQYLSSPSFINEKEEKIIYQKVLTEAKNIVAKSHREDSGILPKDIRFVNLKILERKINGYNVLKLQGYEGENLKFKVLATFLPEYYWAEIKFILLAAGFKKQEIVHEVEGLIPFLKQDSEGIFLDIGGEVTQIFLVKEGKLEIVQEFKAGGRIFSQALSERLGLRETEARTFKERYSKKELSKESADRVREILLFPSRVWFDNLKIKLQELIKGGLLPSDINLFGGASALPDIKEILQEGDWSGLSLAASTKAEILTQKNFFGKIIFTLHLKAGTWAAFLSSPQAIPLFLIYYAKTNKDY